MFDFAQLAETGKAVVEFINQANARLSVMESKIDTAVAEILAHRASVEPQITNLELAHKEIMGWIAEIEGGEIVEAAAAVETAVAQAETAAAVAVAAAETAVAEVPPAESPPEEPPAPEAPLEEVPIPAPEPPTERKRKFVGLF